MATIINNPPGVTTEDSSSVGIVMGLIVAVILLVLFFMFAWPSLTTTPAAPATGGASADINVNLPVGSTDSTAPTASPAY